MLVLLIVGAALSVALMVYLINHAIGPDLDDEPEPDPMSRILETAAEYATVAGNESMASAARSLNQLYLLGFEHLAAGALAREIAFAKGAMKDLGDGQRIELPPLRSLIEGSLGPFDRLAPDARVSIRGGTPFNLCLQSHRHDTAEMAQACNLQAAEDRLLQLSLAPEGNIG